jgi:hypothetical protein
VNLTKGTGVFCLATGASIIALWTMLFATGQVANAATEPLSHAFHLVAEGLTAGLLIVAGVAIVRRAGNARRFFYFAAGMLVIAAMGMLVFYALDGSLPFIALGVLVVGLTTLFLARSRPTLRDLIYLALGTVLYVQLNALGNLLQAGDTTTAAYLVIALGVTLPVTFLAVRRPL